MASSANRLAGKGCGRGIRVGGDKINSDDSSRRESCSTQIVTIIASAGCCIESSDVLFKGDLSKISSFKCKAHFLQMKHNQVKLLLYSWITY